MQIRCITIEKSTLDICYFKIIMILKAHHFNIEFAMNSEISAQLTEAATLMLVGMGFVFAFLTLLIGGIKAIELFCLKFPSTQTAAPAQTRKTLPGNQPDKTDPATVAAISAAIHLHRQSTK